MFRALDTHPPERKVSAWILTIAKNVTVDYLRRKEVTPLPLEISPDTTPPGKIKPSMMPVDYRTDSAPTRVHAEKVRSAFERALRRLRPEYRRCITLRDIEGCAYDDIAEIMNLPVGTVGTYLHRARKQLQEIIGPLLEASPSDSTPNPP